MNNMGQSHPLAHAHTHNVTSQPDHSSSIVPGINIANSPQNRGRRARSAAAPAESHPLPVRKTCRRHYKHKGRPRLPGGGGGWWNEPHDPLLPTHSHFHNIAISTPGRAQTYGNKIRPLVVIPLLMSFFQKNTCLSSLHASSSFTFDLRGTPIDRVLSKLN